MRRYLLLCLLVTVTKLWAQPEIEFFPDKLNIHPFTANILEPRVGFIFKSNVNELRLDIGNSLDLLHYSIDEKTTFSIGADMFTYTLLRSEHDFHFPVDAVDYLFGINAGYKSARKSDEFGVRFRLSHISAHFVDGHFNGQLFAWRDGRPPRVYSREFIELFPYYRWKNFRFYGGFTYIFHVDPVNLGKDIYNAGIEYFTTPFATDLISFFAVGDLRIVNLDKYYSNLTLDAGVKIGDRRGKGIRIYIEYYNGKSIHGEYFDYDRTFTAFGLNLDL